MNFLLESKSLEELETIAEYEYFNRPLLFSCHNSAGEIFLATWVKESDDFELYYCISVSKKKLDAIEKGEISVHDAFLQVEKGIYYEVEVPFEDEKDRIQEVSVTKINKSCLPSPSLYLAPPSKIYYPTLIK
ncbi:DUF6575 domain-containing protein [Spirulina sp. 06S082]|uniref:DUF6575 domain-containing protein n=1 Tax=Spirulina sp. 06S082 TaxID=3110248 RepID=UPI002B214BDB|nr:DUF6575 domain-containing protein [Spirulina sp. 06S082]MEA5468173.1 DUF6575 domain-containing protein [Spirulina sp. 06S082]